MLLYAYFTPKVDFKRKFNHHQSFLYVRFEIESNHKASQVPTHFKLKTPKNSVKLHQGQ